MPLFFNIFSLSAAYKMYCNCVIVVMCLPKEHLGVHENSLKRVCVPDRIRIWKSWFLRRGENWSTRRKTSRCNEENQQQTQPTYGVDAEI